jgi:protein SCO1/2
MARAAARSPALDVPVTDQDGRPLLFGRDVVADRIVVVNFVYTHCAAVCPIQGDRFRELQGLLGARLEREVRLVSISIDPEHDTPDDLKAWGRRHGARPGWYLLTGTAAAVEALTTAIVGAPLGREMHSPFVVVGDGAERWTRTYGLAPPLDMLRLVAAYPSPTHSSGDALP